MNPREPGRDAGFSGVLTSSLAAAPAQRVVVRRFAFRAYPQNR